MRYEAFRMANTAELVAIAHRRVIAAVDWVQQLSDIFGITSIDDKVNIIIIYNL